MTITTAGDTFDESSTPSFPQIWLLVTYAIFVSLLPPPGHLAGGSDGGITPIVTRASARNLPQRLKLNDWCPLLDCIRKVRTLPARVGERMFAEAASEAAAEATRFANDIESAKKQKETPKVSSVRSASDAATASPRSKSKSPGPPKWRNSTDSPPPLTRTPKMSPGAVACSLDFLGFQLSLVRITRALHMDLKPADALNAFLMRTLLAVSVQLEDLCREEDLVVSGRRGLRPSLAIVQAKKVNPPM